MILGRPDKIIVVAPDLVSFYEFLKPRQEDLDDTFVVLLDRRQIDRRRLERRQEFRPSSIDRRRQDRRSPTSDAARAQLSVLGFTILHREGERYTP
jgi:hypothetical protein